MSQKFRAWDIKNKCWLKRFSIDADGSIHTWDEIQSWFDGKKNIAYNKCTFYSIEAILCRSTNRTDKDDLEIFQNDVVSLSFGIPPTVIKFLVCEDNHGDLYLEHINHGGADSSINTLDLEKMSITLLGSSLDNPKLLEKK